MYNLSSVSIHIGCTPWHGVLAKGDSKWSALNNQAGYLWDVAKIGQHWRNKAIVDSRLCPRCATHDEYLLVFTVKQNLVRISTVMLVAFYRHLRIYMMRHGVIMWKHDVINKMPPEKNRARTIGNMHKILVKFKFGHAVFDKQTNTHSHRNVSHPRCEVVIGKSIMVRSQQRRWRTSEGEIHNLTKAAQEISRP